ncbi:hypothetical protein [Embleya sp. NPDC005971]|uniref:hypothetical protein n=1 Tax=Embleya sp. NPDC005971 TaxID=3156724 RepID=UPI003410C8E2
MPRNFARLLTRIWRDPDFRLLPESAQFRYVFLLSQPNLNHAGVLPLTFQRWASSSVDGDAARILADLELLHERRYIVLDRETEEVLIRTFVINDDVYKAPRVMGSMVASAQEIVSPLLRAALLAEVGRIPVHELSEEPTKRAPFTPVRTQIVTLMAALREQFGDVAGPGVVASGDPVGDVGEPVVPVEPDPPPAPREVPLEGRAGSTPVDGELVLTASVVAPVVGQVPDWLEPLARAMAQKGIALPWSFKEDDLALLRADVVRVGLRAMYEDAVEAFASRTTRVFSSRWFYPRWHALQSEANVVPIRSKSPQQAAVDEQFQRSVQRAEERKAVRLAAEAAKEAESVVSAAWVGSA